MTAKQKIKFPIHDTTESANRGQIVSGAFTHNPIPEGTICNIFYNNMRIMIRIDMNFYTNPNLTIIEILKVSHDK